MNNSIRQPAPKSNRLRDFGETCRHCQGESKVFFMPTLTVECKYCNGTGRLSLRDSGDELRYSKACADNRHIECEYDANDCDCYCHLEKEQR